MSYEIECADKIEFDLLQDLIVGVLKLDCFPKVLHRDLSFILIKEHISGTGYVAAWNIDSHPEHDHLTFGEGMAFLVELIRERESSLLKTEFHKKNLVISCSHKGFNVLQKGNDPLPFSDFDWMVEKVESYRDLNLL